MVLIVEKLKKMFVFDPVGDVMVGDKKIIFSFINQNKIKKEYKKQNLKIFQFY